MKLFKTCFVLGTGRDYFKACTFLLIIKKNFMKKEISTGGSVYPIQGYSGMKLIDYFAAHAPTPSGEDIKRQVLKDISANAHNDNNKPPLRSELEIICDLKYKYAAKMVLAREKCLGNM